MKPDPDKTGQLNILALMTDAHGGFGGISQFNRDFLAAMCGWPAVQKVLVVPRLAAFEIGPLPAKLTYDLSGIGGRARYVRAALRHAAARGRLTHIVCGHMNLLPLAWAIAAARRIPITLVVHGVEAWSGTLLRRVMLRRAPSLRVASVSRFTLDRLLVWSPLDPSRCSVVPNTVDFSRFAPGPKDPELVERYGLRGKTVIMTLGRMEPDSRKGFDRVIEILPRLQARIPDLVYLAVGDGAERPRLEALSCAARSSDAVVFVGKVPEASKADILRLADAFVLPSRDEGFGIVLLEAMACGIPVVASSLDGGREAVGNGRWGLVCDPNRDDSIAEAVLNALRCPGGRPAGLEEFGHDRFSIRLQEAFGLSAE